MGEKRRSSRVFLPARIQKLAVCVIALVAGVGLVPAARAGCTTSADMDPAVRAAVERAAQNYFQMVARGDSAGLRQRAVADRKSVV